MSPSVTKLLDLIETGVITAQSAPEAIRQAGGPSLCVLEAVRALAEGGGASSFADLEGEPSDSEALATELDAKASLTENTFEGAQSVQLDALGTAVTSALTLANTTAAAAGSQQASPALEFTGSGWKTQSGGSAQDVQMQLHLLPEQGTSKSVAKLCITSQVGTADPATIASFQASDYGGCVLDLVAGSVYGGRIVGDTGGVWLGRADSLGTNFANAECFIGNYNGSGICLRPNGFLAWADMSNGGNNMQSQRDTYLCKAAAASIQMGLNSATPVDQLFKGPDAVGTNINGGDLRLGPGRSTGSATPACVILQGTEPGGSGTAVQTLVDVMTVESSELISFASGLTLKASGVTLGSSAMEGLSILSAPTHLLGFFGASPVTQPTAGAADGFSGGGGSEVTSGSTFTGDTGLTAYTIGDIVKSLKVLGLIAS